MSIRSMKSYRNHLHTAMLASLLILPISSSHSATIVSTDATWPTTTAAETLNAIAGNTSGRNISGTRKVRQTFQVAGTFTLGAITLSAQDYGNTAFTVKIFEVDDIMADTWTEGTQVGSTITVDAFGSTNTGKKNLSFSLSGAEQFEIAQRNTGLLGYGMEIALVNTGGAAAFQWLHSNTGNSTAPGRYYLESGAAFANATFDMGLALVAIPEPSAALLGGLGLLALLRRRRA